MRAKNQTRPVSFLVMVLAALLLAAGLIAMMIAFGRDPALAPPGICKHIAFAVPAILMLLLILAMIQRVKALRK